MRRTRKRSGEDGIVERKWSVEFKYYGSTIVTICQYRFYVYCMVIRMAGLVRMRAAEVVGAEGVEEGVSGLIRLWKCVEKSSGGWRLEDRD